VSTLVVSDLHLGAHRGTDLARRPELRRGLIEAAAAADEVVLLGDILELREGPAWHALAAAEPFFADLGEAVGDRRVTIVPGNHDHRLIAPWLADRRHRGGAALALEERVSPAQASELTPVIARALGRAELELAYPGAWLRDDVYAHHGHYLDRHLTIPTFERIGIGALERFGHRAAGPDDGPDAYEAVLAPLYALMFALADESPPDGGVAGSGSSQRAWRILAGSGRSRPMLHYLVAAIGFPAAVAVLNAAGLGPLRAKVSGAELRRAGLRAMGEAVSRLQIGASHVVLGHTHRSGPWPTDDTGEWTTPSGARLINTGSWVYEPLFLRHGPTDSPYWPGNAVMVDETDASAPPTLRPLLADAAHADLAAPAG